MSRSVSAGSEAIRSAQDRDIRWWTEAHKEDRAKCIVTCASRIWTDQTPVREEMLRCARLYGSVPLLGLSPKLYRRRVVSTRRSKLALNVIKATSDTYVAMLTDDQPRVTYATNGGDWGLQQRADLLEQFTDGIFFDGDIYDLTPQLALDCCLFGVGVLKPYIEWCGWDEEPEEEEETSKRDQPRIRFDRVHSWRILRDDQEWFSGRGRTQFEITYVDRLGLMQEYPEHANKIATVNARDFDEWGTDSGSFSDTVADDVCIVEAWRLPRSKTSGDGLHCIIVGDVVLFEETWSHTDFPHEFLYRLRPAFGGVWGESLASELEGIQFEINVLLQKIQRSHHLLAAGHWLVENGSEIATGTIDNQIGSIIRFQGTPPVLQAVQAVSADVYAQLDRLYGRAFEIVGISQQIAQGQKPAGLNSGKAQLVYADIVSKRFQPSYRLYQHFMVRLARKIITLARIISEKVPDYAVKATGPDMMETVKWADANLEDEEFLIKPFATNELADTPEGKMAIIEGLANSGYLMDKPDVMRLLNVPDLKSYQSLSDATYDWTMKIVDGIIRHGEYVGPEPFMSKSQMIDSIGRVQRAYYKASLEKVPEDRLQMLRDWMAQATELVTTNALKLPDPTPPPPPPGATPPPGMAPPGMPPPGAPPPMPVAS